MNLKTLGCHRLCFHLEPTQPPGDVGQKRRFSTLLRSLFSDDCRDRTGGQTGKSAQWTQAVFSHPEWRSTLEEHFKRMLAAYPQA